LADKLLKLVTVVGARPQFIKAAVISKAIREHNNNGEVDAAVEEILVHTGQHYDYEMSQVFFDQLDIPKPDYHLGVGSGSHGEQTGKMLTAIERVLMEVRPDYLLTYGDTNSTLAGALAAAKLKVPVAHVEAGLRSFNRDMPEEVNRVLVDHLSSILFAPTAVAVANLEKEGISNGVKLVPDTMEEALFSTLQVSRKQSGIFKLLNLHEPYFLATIHRAENTDNYERLSSILKALREISKVAPVVLPLHPRTKKVIEADKSLQVLSAELNCTDPVSYVDMVTLQDRAKIILTDSGGVQKEAFWLGVPCITLRDETEWIETVKSGMNHLVGSSYSGILSVFGKLNTLESSRGSDSLVEKKSGFHYVKHLLESI